MRASLSPGGNAAAISLRSFSRAFFSALACALISSSSACRGAIRSSLLAASAARASVSDASAAAIFSGMSASLASVAARPISRPSPTVRYAPSLSDSQAADWLSAPEAAQTTDGEGNSPLLVFTLGLTTYAQTRKKAQIARIGTAMKLADLLELQARLLAVAQPDDGLEEAQGGDVDHLQQGELDALGGAHGVSWRIRFWKPPTGRWTRGRRVVWVQNGDGPRPQASEQELRSVGP